MKYALPQARINLNTMTKPEKKLAKLLFGNAEYKLKNNFAPFPFILHCYQRSMGFEGDDIGMYAKVCKDFFPTPTDKGICLTKNMDIKDIIHINEEYKTLFEPDLQSSGKSVNIGTEESENILAFFTGQPSFLSEFHDSTFFQYNDFRVLEGKFGDKNKAAQVQLKFHQSRQLPHLFEDDKLKPTFTYSLFLDSGMEYFIDVTPHIVKTTKAFQEMPFEQRNCRFR